MNLFEHWKLHMEGVTKHHHTWQQAMPQAPVTATVTHTLITGSYPCLLACACTLGPLAQDDDSQAVAPHHLSAAGCRCSGEQVHLAVALGCGPDGRVHAAAAGKQAGRQSTPALGAHVCVDYTVDTDARHAAMLMRT